MNNIIYIRDGMHTLVTKPINLDNVERIDVDDDSSMKGFPINFKMISGCTYAWRFQDEAERDNTLMEILKHKGQELTIQ